MTAPAKVEAYLRAATCLLLPRTAKPVQAELRGHFYQDMQEAQGRGLTEEAAWAHALALAGPAWKTALGLGRVHTLGLLLRGLLLGAALGGASYAGQSVASTHPQHQVGQP